MYERDLVRLPVSKVEAETAKSKRVNICGASYWFPKSQCRFGDWYVDAPRWLVRRAGIDIEHITI
jgi:hypothetical protein